MKFKLRADLAKKPRQAAKRKRIIEVELETARPDLWTLLQASVVVVVAIVVVLLDL